MKKNALFIFALTAIIGLGSFAACNNKNNNESSSETPTTSVPAVSSPEESYPEASSPEESSPEDSSVEEQVVYGWPVAEVGHDIKDADLLQDGETRCLVYTTNEESAEEDNVIATRSATNDGNGWVYGEETIVITGEVGGWDEYIGSAAMVKGVFTYGGASYSWLMAYCATSQVNDSQQEIGLAVANEVTGEWTKVGTQALLQYNEAVYGTSMVGLYAPSLVNLNQESIIRIYYTYADAYGHFAQFVDINAANLDLLYAEGAQSDYTLISGVNQLPTNGNYASGDLAPMFPNADFAHDAATGKVVAVKDYSPTAATTPAYADKIELVEIAEAELYTAAVLNGWNSLKLWDMTDTLDMMYERLYSACLVTDAYGCVNGATAYEVIYNVCELAMDNADWMFTQNLQQFDFVA